MPLSSYTDYLNKLKLNICADFQQAGATPTTRPYAIYRNFLPTPAIPTTSVSLDKTSDCAIGPIPASSTGKLAVIGGRFNTSSVSGYSVTVIDLLNHNGGLSGIVATEQTTNLPTAALTRHTSGEGVRVGLVIYTAVGTTATSVTIRYTNQAGVANQTSTAFTFGGSSYREANRIIIVPLAAGDTGVLSVEGVTLAASTGTAGNFGVVLFKPLAMLPLESTTGVSPNDAVSSGGLGGAFGAFDDTACLSLLGSTAVSQLMLGGILLAEI